MPMMGMTGRPPMGQGAIAPAPGGQAARMQGLAGPTPAASPQPAAARAAAMAQAQNQYQQDMQRAAPASRWAQGPGPAPAPTLAPATQQARRAPAPAVAPAPAAAPTQSANRWAQGPGPAPAPTPATQSARRAPATMMGGTRPTLMGGMTSGVVSAPRQSAGMFPMVNARPTQQAQFFSKGGIVKPTKLSSTPAPNKRRY